jgi:hypothetical protein
MLHIVRAPALIARARAHAETRVIAARELLEQLEPSVYRAALGALIDDQIDREI